MHPRLLDYIRCPVSGTAFEVFPFATRFEDIWEGVLRSRDGYLYPILSGVPSLLADSFPSAFLERFAKQIEASVGKISKNVSRQANADWSFSAEWDHFFSKDVKTTWGWRAEQRLEMFLQEIQLSRDALRGKLICDAGCGNGVLTEGIASLGATVVGIDRSTSVALAEARRRSPNVYYVQGDLCGPLFPRDTFDVVYSSGVLHHNPSTRRAFDEVASWVKPGGLLFVWLYHRPRSRPLKHWIMGIRESLIRPWCSRLPRHLREVVVRTDAGVLWLLTRIIGERRTYSDLLIGSCDYLTPRYAWRHTPVEVASWFFETGFSAPVLTHWDNPNGFGMVARKYPLLDTPGIRFGRPQPLRLFPLETSK